MLASTEGGALSACVLAENLIWNKSDGKGRAHNYFVLIVCGLPMGKIKVLIADDHSIVRLGVRELIERDDCFEVVGEAQNPTELVSLSLQLKPDVVVTDYHMPGDQTYGDGIKLIDYMVRSHPGMQILVLTMVSNPLLLFRMYELGVSGVIQKNNNFGEIMVALKRISNNQEYRSCAFMRVKDSVIVDKSSIISRMASLSVKEHEVIRHFISGRCVRDIAILLNRSVKTISAQKISAMRKLGVNTDQALMAFCIEEDGLFFH